MKRMSVVFCMVAFASAALAQTINVGVAPSGLAILQQVSHRFADAKLYRIESVEENTTSNEFERNWQKTVLMAVEAPSHRYRFEGHSGFGGAVRVSDGTTRWTYHLDEHAYTKANASDPTANFGMAEMGAMRAQNLRKEMAEFAGHYKSAERLPDETLVAGGKEISCYVVHVSSVDMKRLLPSQSPEQTFWIDKSRRTIVKSLGHLTTYIVSGGARIAMQEEMKATYNVVELDTPIADSVFAFTPPADAKLVPVFTISNAGSINFVGQSIPALRLKSTDGKQVLLDSFRGRPVLLDVWATWCMPCVKSLPQLALLYEDTKDKGLIFLTLDTDEEANTGAEMLGKHGYQWQNFHDDGSASDALGVNGVPRTILIDADGKVVFDKTDAGDNELRAEIAKLGPEYASLAPKPIASPCPVSK